MASAERIEMPARRRLLDHRHATGHLLAVISGAVVEDGVTYRAGDVRISSASDRHFLRFDRDTLCIVVQGEVPPLAAGSRRVVRLPEVTRRLARAPHEDAVIEIVKEAIVTDAAAREAPAWLAELESRLDDGLHARRISDLARAAGVSREHLARTYRRHFGTSVTEALKARRLHRAWHAMMTSGQALADIAGDIGFADQSHMTRQFREWIGMSPATIRRAARKVTRLQDGSLAIGVS